MPETFENVERKKVKMTGTCLYCGQTAIVEAQEGTAQEDLDALATDGCDCKGARQERERGERLEAAGKWAQEVFRGSQLSAVLCSIKAVFEGSVDSVTIQIEKYTHRIDVDAKGMLRIKTKFQDDGIMTF